MKNEEEFYIEGLVTYLSVSGYRQNSAQLLFTIEDNKKDDNTAIKVTSDYEPQVFSSMANILSSAYFSKSQVTVGYHTLIDGNYAFEVKLPILKKGDKK
jgi:hypothetical protein